MKIFVVLCLVTVALARPHHRQNVNSWTKVGRSYVKVFDDAIDWFKAHATCENQVYGSVHIDDEKVDAAVGHLAYDKTEEMHQFLVAAVGEDPATRKLY